MVVCGWSWWMELVDGVSGWLLVDGVNGWSFWMVVGGWSWWKELDDC